MLKVIYRALVLVVVFCPASDTEESISIVKSVNDSCGIDER